MSTLADGTSLNPDNTIGPVLVGVFLAIYLTSTTNQQVLAYLASTLDHWSWRALMSLIALGSTAQSGVVCYALYSYLIINFGNTARLAVSFWPLVVHSAISTGVGFLVQLYYCAKISTFASGTTRVILLTAILIFALAQTAFGVLASYNTATLPATSDLYTLALSAALGWQGLAQIAAALVADMLITGAMLREARSPHLTVRSEGVFAVLTRLGCETNAVTTITTALDLAMRLAYQKTGISLSFSLVLPKLLLLCMMVSIARQEPPLSGVDSRGYNYGKRASSLTDFFRGTPSSAAMRRAGDKPITLSAIGAPMAPASNGISRDSKGWFRRTAESMHLANPSGSTLAGNAALGADSLHQQYGTAEFAPVTIDLSPERGDAFTGKNGLLGVGAAHSRQDSASQYSQQGGSVELRETMTYYGITSPPSPRSNGVARTTSFKVGTPKEVGGGDIFARQQSEPDPFSQHIHAR